MNEKSRFGEDAANSARSPLALAIGSAHFGHMNEIENIDSAIETLTGKLLVAMPGMGDPRFAHAVVFLCAHDDEQAMGLIINRPLAELTLSEMFEQLGIANGSGSLPDLPICFGGPVEQGRGFVLHETSYAQGDAGHAGRLEVDDTFAMTATLDILDDIAQGEGPDQAIVALGYAGWGRGQLESEIAQNAWLICEAAPDLVFNVDMPRKWEAALAKLGIDPILLSAQAGRA